MTYLYLSGGAAATLIMYYESFPMSAGTSYRRGAARYHALSVVICDEGKLGGSDVCLHLWGEMSTLITLFILSLLQTKDSKTTLHNNLFCAHVPEIF